MANHSDKPVAKTLQPTLAEMLERFDPARHGGERLAFVPVGREVL